MATKPLNFKIVAVDLTKKAFRSLSRSLSIARKALFSFKAGIVAAVGAGGLGLLVKSSLDSIDRISKLSRTLGVSVKDLRKLELAAELSGVQLETLARGFRTLNKGMVDFVAEGTGEAADAFGRLGITSQELRETMGDQFKVLQLVAKRFDEVENSAVKSSIAQELFGGRASEMMLILEDGGKELEKISRQAQDFGLVMSAASARGVENANDAFTRLGSIFKGLRDNIVSALAPALQTLADQLTESLKTMVEDAGGFQKFAEGLILSLLQFMKEATLGIVKFLKEMAARLARFFDLLGAFSETAKEAAESFREFEKQRIGVSVFFDGLIARVQSASEAFEDLNTDLDETNDNLNSGKTALQEYADAAKSAKIDIQELAVKGLRSLEDTLIDVVMGANSAKDAFKAMASSILKDLLRIQIQKGITAPLAQALGSMMTPSTGTTGMKAMAMGGHVGANRPYMVGERGAEMFVPGASGTIIPNNKLGGGGVTVNQTINLSAGVSQTVRAEVIQMMPQIAENAKAAVLDARRRGGTFAAAF